MLALGISAVRASTSCCDLIKWSSTVDEAVVVLVVAPFFGSALECYVRVVSGKQPGLMNLVLFVGRYQYVTVT